MRILARLAALGDEELARSARWGGVDADVRYVALHQALEREQNAAVRARTAYRGTEAQRILGLAQLAYGDLRGVLAGASEEQLDRAPRDREWSARETLAHTTRVERSYRAAALWAITRSDGDPVPLPPERRPEPDPADTAGDGTNVALRLGLRRAETDRELAGVSGEQLTRASRWAPGEKAAAVDVRFRLHRFASHLVEHTVQCERALEAAGVAFGDARRVVRRLSGVRAMHERITPAEDLARLDALHQQALAEAGI